MLSLIKSLSLQNQGSASLTTEIQSSIVPNSALDTSIKLNKSSNSGPVKVTSPKAHVGGRSQAEWADKWWKENALIPASSNPTVTEQPFEQYGPVQFLAGVAGSGSAERNITISTGTHLYVPVITQVVDNYGFDPAWSEQDSRDAANAIVDTVTSQFFNSVTSRGETSLISNWENYRQSSKPGGFSYVAGEDNVLGYEPGVPIDYAVQDGYWVMLNPLRPGDYTFHFGATGDYSKMKVDQNGNGIEGDTLGEQLIQDVIDFFAENPQYSSTFYQDITYHVTVVPQSKMPTQNLDISALASV
ncbi:MAG TPA: hypothetical protein IGS53_17170 [Leptolyngbyaceae cyanobacterium M33_DOE_097]|uniref:Uncharacterized protein n=1 Tax=Oscillatoriales cyanobacterium SpSt-418 TaxID=2282169 RepID=A0A7C3KH67_9CYAN|nr:hypothetical protein [Leptolyngbyaceae cyanobacterium M33_DOE_097]